ncbi:putative TIM-barrel fold metal-dependent hydrolase [Actinocorallia herbida]|uniref:Putative TIM-barrel fold metal-dependent hydrolase n=1 Tax=Actinocorallia herbida TaxID=58109 RepID=A0A3N1CVX7_9ACTN|nr:amidohydrolase family protein [Actinocorallia herbida]ROO85437.1 putative TIM-barrel fold metal-dependent hydrolase [Actinocorallia herbida]
MSDSYVLISTDSHAGLPAEGYRDYIDAEYREAFDAAQEEAEAMRQLAENDEHRSFLAEWNAEIGHHGGMKGAYDPAVRTKEMDHDGVAAEVVFPDADSAGVGGVAKTPFAAGLGSTGDDDAEMTLAGAWAHNRWIAEFCQDSPERRAGVAIVPLHDVAAAVKMIEWSADHGLRGGIMIPTKWGALPSYNDPVYDPVWAAASATGLPVHTHSGVGPDPDDYGYTPGLIAIYATEAYWWAARPLWALILGGVFERHPALKYVVAENGAWWTPDIVSRMDSKWEGHHATRKFGPAAFRAGLTMKPGDYFRRNCFMAASVMGDVEVDRRHEIGVGNLMWGSDYPHPEGTWPNTRPWLAERFGRVPQEDVRQILGLTAAEVYGFDLDALAPHVDRVGPTVADIHGSER